MADVNYTAFLPEVLPYAVGVPEPTALNAIRNATTEFLRGSHFLQLEIDPISVVANINEYDLDVDTGYEVVSIRALYFNNKRLQPLSELDLRRRYTDWRTTKGTPKGFFMRTDRTIALFPYPDAPGKLTGTVAVCTNIRSTGVDSVVVDQHLEDIAAGALARLLMIPGEPYFQPEMAMLQRKRFDSAIARVRARKNESLVNAPLSVRFY